MTYQLAALRFRSIGERSARFTDLTLDLTAPSDEATAPHDSVIWLRNGGGKSSILSLLYAQLLPHANDFMGKMVQRSLTDYVDSGDTSHVVAVWQPAEIGRNLLGDAEDILITGVVHEWAELRRPAKAAESRDRLNTHFYVFHAVPGVLDLATMPFAGETGRPKRLTEFVKALHELAKPHARQANLVATHKQHVWNKALLDRHLDPEIFRTQKQMNHVEGGVEDLFKFAAAKDFIDFLLDLATQPDAAVSVATRLANITALLAAKPHKIEERDFCNAAADELGQVADHHARLLAAIEELTAANQVAVQLAASFASAVRAAEGIQEELREQHKAFQEARTTANNDRSTASDLLYLYRREGARLRVNEAQTEEQQAIAKADETRGLAQAWEVSLQLAGLAELESRLAQAELEAAAEEEELAPLREEHARHAALLRQRLDTLAEEADFAAALAQEQQESAEVTASQEDVLADEARTEQQEASADEVEARTQLEMLHQRRRDGVTRGYLPTETTSPEAHLDTVAAERNEYEDQLQELAANAETRRQRRGEINEKETTLASEHSSIDASRTSTVKRRVELGERLAALIGAARLRDLAEVTDGETIDLWAEAPLLQRRLSDAVMAADDERILRRAEQHADQRTIEAQERNQVLPSSLDAERVERQLIEAGYPAQTGWAHLRTVMPADQLVTALNIPEIARLGCGVVVPTTIVADAVRALDERSLVTTALVGVYSAEAADVLIRGDTADTSGIGAPAWTALQPGLIDPAEAEATVRLLKERAHAHALKDQQLAKRCAADDELRRQIAQFLDDCPAGHLINLDEDIERFDRKLKTIEDDQERNRAELQGLDAAERLDEANRNSLQDQIRHLDATIGWLEDLIPALADESVWRDRMVNAGERADDARERATRHTANARQALIKAKQWEAAAKADQIKASGYRAERDGIPDSWNKPINAADDLATPLDTLRRAQSDAMKAVESRASQSVLADRVQNITGEVADARSQISHVPSEVRAAAERLLASPDGQEAGLRTSALARARQEADSAAAERGAAGNQVEQRRIDLNTVERQYRQAPRRTLPTVPADSAEAEILAAEQETLSQQAQERVSRAEELMDGVDQQATRAKTRQQLLSTLLESLPDPGGTAAEPFGDDEDTARGHARQVRSTISDIEKKVSTAQNDLNAAVEELRRTAGRFAEIAGPMKDRVANDPSSVLGPHAEDLARRLRLRGQTLADELDSIALDQVILNEALAHLVKESLDMLGKAERASLMTTASGSWEGKKVLRISFDRPSDTDLVVFAERVIDLLVQKGLKPEGMPLLKAAVHEAAGPRGFTVKVLKPTDDTTGTTEDISRLAKWSGGEKLTVCVALYCTLAALRAINIGQKGRSGGVLLLDNPIGRASSAPLVRLQREVAASHGVQLVYTTGVKDPAAVIQFPNVIRLDNREGRTNNRRYIVPENLDEQSVSSVTGIRVAHSDHKWENTSPSQEQTG